MPNTAPCLNADSRRAERDVVCACCAVTLHLWHVVSYAHTLPPLSLAALLALCAVNALSILVYATRPAWYLRIRPAVNAVVRLGMAALPSAVLHAAYRADQPVAQGASALRLAWRALLSTRAVVLLVSGSARRMSLAPQLSISLLAFLIAAGNRDATCATPLMQHPRVQRLLSGITTLPQLASLLVLPGPLLATVPPLSCSQAVVFLQLVVGVVLPTLVYLRDESDAAAPAAGDASANGGEGGVNWERRCFLWVKEKRDSLGLPSLVLGTTSFLGTCWALANLF